MLLTMAPPDTSTYRPALLILVGVTATFAAILIHQRYLRHETSVPDTGLHRSNAIRRPNARRRRPAAESDSSGSSRSATVADLAISRLLARDANDDEYDTFAPSVSLGTLPVERLPEFRLIPSQLPS